MGLHIEKERITPTSVAKAGSEFDLKELTSLMSREPRMSWNALQAGNKY